MATYRPGRLTAVAFDKIDASPYLNSSDWSSTLGTGEVTHYGSTAKEFIPGLSGSTLSLAGLFDGSSSLTNATFDSVADALGNPSADFPVTMFFDGGIAVGRRCAITKGIETDYTPSTPVANVASIKLGVITNGRPGDAFCLTPAGAITTATTVNNASVDNGATIGATQNGGLFVIHVTANTWSGTTTVKLQHSSDNSTWVDLSTQVVPATTQAAYTLPVAGTVNRYIRAQVVTAAGTGSVNVIAAFART